MVEPLCQWVLPREVAVDADCVAIGVARGISGRMLRLLAARGVASPDELRLFLADAEAGLHDPRLLPDAEAASLAGVDGAGAGRTYPRVRRLRRGWV